MTIEQVEEVYKIKFINLEKDIENLRSENKELKVDIKELKEETDDIKIIKQDINYMKVGIDRTNEKLNRILEKPGKRWDLIVVTIISVIASSVVTMIIGNIIK